MLFYIVSACTIGILLILPFWRLSGVSDVDIVEQALRHIVSGNISGKEASQFLEKLEKLVRLT